MSFHKTLVGQQFGRLLVVEEVVARRTLKHRFFRCRCDCGTTTTTSQNALKTGKTQSCGCLCRERTADAHLRHGHARVRTRSREYGIWCGIKNRCYNPKVLAYPRYGGRGVVVCERWRDSFENFLADMGPCPPGRSIDRYPDNDGPYAPGNCRWGTPIEQARNRRPASRQHPKARSGNQPNDPALRPSK